MGKCTVFLHKSVQDEIDLIATIVDTSRSEVVEMFLRHGLDNVIQNEIWEDWEDLLEAYNEKAETESEEEGSESEDETEEESEEEEEEEE